MKKIILPALFILLACSVNFGYAQTVASIIEKHIAAMGGREKVMSLNTVLMMGTFQANGDTAKIPIITTKKHLVGSRIDIEANNTRNYQVITPQQGWIYTPVAGDKTPRPLLEDQFKVGQVQLDLHGPFIDPLIKKNSIEFIGNESYNGVLCHKLKVTAPNKLVMIYYIDSQSFFIVKTSTKMFQFGALEDVVSTYSRYQQNAAGYWFPYEFVGPRGITIYTQIESNVVISNDIFKVN